MQRFYLLLQRHHTFFVLRIWHRYHGLGALAASPPTLLRLYLLLEGVQLILQVFIHQIRVLLFFFYFAIQIFTFRFHLFHEHGYVILTFIGLVF